jgi:hypothetical protein
MMTKENWREIHQEFSSIEHWGKERQKLWKSREFDYQQTKERAKVLGEKFKPSSDWAFCVWLRDEKHLTVQEVEKQGNAENLRKKYNKFWINIHPNFAKWCTLRGNTIIENYQHRWEQQGLTYQDAKEWVPAGFKPEDDYYYNVQNYFPF